jgi:hypothetical protein
MYNRETGQTSERLQIADVTCSEEIGTGVAAAIEMRGR